jgi:hypothetical protein
MEYPKIETLYNKLSKLILLMGVLVCLGVAFVSILQKDFETTALFLLVGIPSLVMLIYIIKLDK